MRRLISVGIAVLFLAAACGLLGGGKNTPPPPGRRDYTWTVDSVYSAPSGWINDIWGASPNDVWVVSPGGLYHLWHYDGTAWRLDSLYSTAIIQGLNCIYGFSQNDIWAGGEGGRLYHYDGKTWKHAYTYTQKGQVINEFTDIWGSSADNIFAVGLLVFDSDSPYSYLLHYDGKDWKEVLVTDFVVQFERVRVDRGIVYITAYKAGASDTTLFYDYGGGRLNKLFVTTGEAWMNVINGQLFSLVDDTLYRSPPGAFGTGIVLPTQNEIYNLNGRSVNDLFFTSSQGLVHYNGVDMQYLFRIDIPFDYFYSDGLILKHDVFFVTNDFHDGTNLIYHGVLPKEEKESMP